MQQAKKYDKEFKIQAVKLALEIGGAKAAAELNVPDNTIYGWVHKYQNFIGYWNNRRICMTNEGLPPVVKRKQYYDKFGIAA